MTITLKCITVFFVSLSEPHLRVMFLGDIEQKWFRVMYQQINISCENFKMFFLFKIQLYYKMEHI